MDLSSIQSVILHKSYFPTLTSAKNEMKNLKFPTPKVDEKEHSWRFRQADPSEFTRFTTKRIKPGVSFVIGWR